MCVNSIVNNIYDVELFVTQPEYEELVSLGIVDYNKIYNIWESDYIDFGQCGDNAYYYLYEDGSLLITGIGTTWNYEYADSPFYKLIHASENWIDIKKVVIAGETREDGHQRHDAPCAKFPESFHFCFVFIDVLLASS